MLLQAIFISIVSIVLQNECS